MTAIDGGTIEAPAGEPAEQRLRRIHESVCELIDWHSPESVALESLYFGKNVRSAIAVGQARGVIMLAAASRELGCFDYTPQAVKLVGLRDRLRREGPGQAHGRRPARPAGRAARRTTPPTPSPSPSATRPTSRAPRPSPPPPATRPPRVLEVALH